MNRLHFGKVSVLAAAAFLLSFLPAAMGADFTWSFGPDVAVPDFNCLDIDPAVVRDGGELYIVCGAGGAEHLRIRRFEGADLDSLHALPAYNTYLKRYLALGTTMQGKDYVATCTDLARQDWTPMEQFSQSTPRLYWYNFSLDERGERWSTGKTFRLYSSCCHVGGVATKYMQVTLAEGRTPPQTLTGVFPPESVNDHNPGWDKSLKP